MAASGILRNGRRRSRWRRWCIRRLVRIYTIHTYIQTDRHTCTFLSIPFPPHLHLCLCLSQHLLTILLTPTNKSLTSRDMSRSSPLPPPHNHNASPLPPDSSLGDLDPRDLRGHDPPFILLQQYAPRLVRHGDYSLQLFCVQPPRGKDEDEI